MGPAGSVVDGFEQCGTAAPGALPKQLFNKAAIAGSALITTR